MPAREEIAAWLREEKFMYEQFSTIIKGTTKDLLLARVEVIEERAAQVEAMRCETCQWWDNSPWQVSPETRLCLFPEKRGNAESWSGMTECGPKFGCFHHEQKV